MLVLVSTSVLFAQDKTVDQGVYTSAQAARGAKLFESNCVMCHREPGGTAPVLAGERFTKTFSDATLQTVFTTIKTTMPRNAPGSLSDAGVCRPRLALAEDQQLRRWDERARRRGPHRDQDSRIDRQPRLRPRAGRRMPGAERSCLDVEPRHRASAHPRARGAQGRCCGATGRGAARRSDLPPATGLRPPAGWKDQKVVAKGFLTKAGSEDRVNVTSMRALTSSCQLRYNFYP